MNWKSVIGFLHPEKAEAVRSLIENYVSSDSVCLEIGTYCGKSLMHLLEHSNPKHVYAIDPFEGDINTQLTVLDNDPFAFDTISTPSQYDYDKVKKKFLGFTNVTIIKDKSPLHDDIIPNIIDYAYIDGDHTYSGASADLNWVYKKMNSGVIVIDDYAIDTVQHAVDDFVKNNALTLQTSSPSHPNNVIAWIHIQ
jgi:hypothetical protein